MEVLKLYSSDSENGSQPTKEKESTPSIPNPPVLEAPAVYGPSTSATLTLGVEKIEAAPEVNIKELEEAHLSAKMNTFYTDHESVSTAANHLTGHVQTHFSGANNFDEQYNLFSNYGYAMDPADSHADPNIYIAKKDVTINPGQVPNIMTSQSSKQYKKQLKSKRKKRNNPAQADYLGPWNYYDGEDYFMEKDQNTQLTQEQKTLLAKLEERRKKKLEEEKEEENKPIRVNAKTVFHVPIDKDYQGKSILSPPSELRYNKHICYIPKKIVHTWTGHTGGVQVVKLFPKFGHLMLSGSHDFNIKLWDVLSHKKILRTYMGHSGGVKDLCFSNNGKQFLSCGYDKNILLWDTEYGKIIKAFTNRKIPYCCVFNPDEDKQHIFLVGSANKRIVQFDINTGEITQQYDEHLGAVNTVTFIDNNKRFVSTSDDKKIFLWEFGIPVVVKHISEPDMASIPATAMHPNNKYLACQSMDNKIVIYDAKGNFKLNRKKKFTGHMNAGYSIGLSFSPDGKFICSGDTEGRLWFWDFKTAKNYRIMNVHDHVTMGVQWHPIHPSKIITCSWDNTIKLWD